MPAEFMPIDRDTPQLFPPSVQDYLPEKHLARFVVDIVDELDLKHLVGAYRGTGSAAYHPALLVALLFYGYATGVFSSRKLAQEPTIRWPFALSAPTPIQITERLLTSASASSANWKPCSSRFC